MTMDGARDLGGLRITVVSPSLRMGGAERVALEQAVRLSERTPTTLVTLEGPDVDFYHYDDRLSRRSGPPAGRRAVLRFLREATADADLVVAHVDHVVLWTLTAWLGRRRRPPTIAVEHADPRSSPRSRSRRLARRALLRTAAHTVVLTDVAADWHATHTGVEPTVIPNCVPLGSPIDGDREDRTIDVFAAGRLVHHKGFDVLLRALADPPLRDRVGRVVIAGEGTRSAELAELARRLDVRVEWAGAVTDMAAWYAQAKVFALPSRSEGHPLALLEAMAAGCAPVASDCPTGPREIIEHGVDGLLVEPDDPTALAASIVRLLDDDHLRAGLADAARRKAAQFGPERYDASWDRVFDDVMTP